VPTGVVASGVEDRRHQAACVLHGDCLGVEIEDSSGLVEKHGVGDAHLAVRVGLVGGICGGGGGSPEPWPPKQGQRGRALRRRRARWRRWRRPARRPGQRPGRPRGVRGEPRRLAAGVDRRLGGGGRQGRRGRGEVSQPYPAHREDAQRCSGRVRGERLVPVS
jgi:hypothetical protein